MCLETELVTTDRAVQDRQDQAETAMRLALRTERRETQPHRHPYTQTIHRATTMITIPATAAVPVILILPRLRSCVKCC